MNKPPSNEPEDTRSEDEKRLDAACDEYIETGDPQPVLDAYRKQSRNKIDAILEEWDKYESWRY